MKYGLSFLLLFLVYYGQAQPAEYAFRIYFKDKAATAFSLNDPHQFLAPRAIQRRAKYQIAIDSSDLPVCRRYIDTVLARSGGRLHCTSKWHNTMVVLLPDSSALPQVAALPFVAKERLVAVYPNGFQLPASGGKKGRKPAAFNQNYYGAAWEQIALCNGQTLHQQGLNGKGILMAFIDAGFEGVNQISAFDSLRQSGRIADRWNFAHQTAIAAQEFTHGTEVLSCIAANLPQTFVGTAPQVSVALYTSEDINSEQPIEMDNWAAAAERADSLGADMITTSLGYNTFDPPFPDEQYQHYDGKSTFIARSANRAVSKGIFVAASAGNEGNTPWQYILTPGDADSVLTIGAVDRQNLPFSGSSRGPNADGVIKPDVVAMGVSNAVFNASGSLEQATGTSFATPVIAGLAACLLQQDSTLTPFRLRQVIRASADHFHHPDNQVGYGLPDFGKALQELTGIARTATFDQDSHFIIAPNPIQRGNLQILFFQPPQQTFQAIVRDMNGRVILRKTFKPTSSRQLTFPLSPLAPGTYRLTIQTKQYRATTSFVQRQQG